MPPTDPSDHTGPTGTERARAADRGPAVELVGLTKRYGERVAVDALSLRVPRGSCFGIVGPNGAGKTTTLRMATGLLRPDSGRALVDGIDVWVDPVEAKRRFGAVPDDLRLFERLTGRQLLTFTGRLRGLAEDVASARCEEVLDVLAMRSNADELVTDYSQGMRKKLGVGAAILHAPVVLFLDEPYESVDPVSARALQAVLDRYRADGGTVVLSSHVMATVERLCDHVAVVHDGRVVRSGPTRDVCSGASLEEAFVEAVGGRRTRKGLLDWLVPAAVEA